MKAIGQEIPSLNVYFPGTTPPIAGFTIFDYLNAIFGITARPISYQFWFIRDLIGLVIFTPLIYLILKRLPKLILILCFVFWMLDWWPLPVPSNSATLFFYVGALLGFLKYNLCAVDIWGKTLLAIYAGVSIVDVWTKGPWLNMELHKIGILWDCVLLFILSNLLHRMIGQEGGY